MKHVISETIYTLAASYLASEAMGEPSATSSVPATDLVEGPFHKNPAQIHAFIAALYMADMYPCSPVQRTADNIGKVRIYFCRNRRVGQVVHVAKKIVHITNK